VSKDHQNRSPTTTRTAQRLQVALILSCVSGCTAGSPVSEVQALEMGTSVTYPFQSQAFAIFRDENVYSILTDSKR
jgi:hypothetical protein